MKGRKTFISNYRAIWRIALVFTIIIIASGLQTPVCADNVVLRDIMEFVDAQGTEVGYSYNYVGWLSPEDTPILLAMVDYAGVTNDKLDLRLGTAHSGIVTERLLPDGRAEVMVKLYTKNALIWVADLGEEFDPNTEFNCTDCPLIFGALGEDVSEGAEPALGRSILQLKYISKAPGEPLADLFSTFVTGDTYDDQELISVSFHVKGFGLLTDGSPGVVIVDQIGRFATSGQGAALEDSFPVERIKVKKVGRGVLR